MKPTLRDADFAADRLSLSTIPFDQVVQSCHGEIISITTVRYTWDDAAYTH